jgi:hypothetical protein
MNDTLWSYSYNDDTTVSINTGDVTTWGDTTAWGDTITISDCDSETFTLDDVTIGFGNYEGSINIGKTKLSETDVKDLLAIAGMIKDMPDGSGIKKLFNTHRAMNSLGDTNNADTESN